MEATKLKDLAKRNIVFGILGILLLVPIVLLGYFQVGQTESSMLAAPERIAPGVESNPESQIREIIEQYYKIAGGGDRSALKRFSEEISSPDYKYSSELGVMDKEAAIGYFDTLELKFVTAEFENLTVRAYGPARRSPSIVTFRPLRSTGSL